MRYLPGRRPALACACVLLHAACGAPAASRGAASTERADDAVAAAAAARGLLDALPDSARATATRPFEHPQRTEFYFVPTPHFGLPLWQMNEPQQGRVQELLRTALGPEGLTKARGIIANEPVLGALEAERRAQGRPGVPNWRRDSTLYYTLVFGTPAPDSVWGWRFEGHHLSVNVTRVGREPQVVAPVFMGANPARVPSGPKAGSRLLAAEEDEARALIKMLSAERRARAIFAAQALPEIVTNNDPTVKPMEFQGLPASEMSDAERAQLRRLLAVYAARLTPAAARDQLERIERAGFGRVHFGWAGGVESGDPHYYRIHGPTVLVEYDDTQNDANHIHTVWRDLERDFGGDLLRAHYAKHRH